MYFGTAGTSGSELTFTHPPGPGLLPDTALNLQGSILGTPVRTDTSGTYTYLGSGNGSSAPERYMAYDPANPNSTTPIQPGGTVVLKSEVRAPSGCWQ
jgi:hypothetical protein